MTDSTPDIRELPIAELATDVLRQGGVFTFIATGGSMWPHLRAGDLITVRPIDANEPLRVGSVVFYLTPAGKASLHRVVSVSQGILAVRGDSQTGSPEQVKRGDVMGKAVIRQRDGRTVDLTGRRRSVEAMLIARGGTPRVYALRFLRRLAHSLRRRRTVS